MRLSEKVTVNKNLARSVNLERDVGNSVSNYLLTESGVDILKRIKQRIEQPKASCAWNIVGNYGAGKSAFSLFLTHLLEGDKDALDLCGQHGVDFKAVVNYKKGKGIGYCPILITGGAEKLNKKFVDSLFFGIKAFLAKHGLDKKHKLNPPLSFDEEIEAGQALQQLKNLHDLVMKAGGAGLLIVFDELGKTLEYEARINGDIYLLQTIAEYANAHSKNKVVFLGILHQSIDHYLGRLNDKRKSEWRKVEGRFESLPFVNNHHQTVSLASRIFGASLSSNEKAAVSKKLLPAVNEIVNSGLFPSSVSKNSVEKLFMACYPLHPLAAILLPLLCQKIGQNERTLFSYFGGDEKHGFMSCLDELSLGGFILPHHLYDYFIANRPPAGGWLIQRKWIESEETISRLGNQSDALINALKAIAIFNIVGAQGKFTSSPALLNYILDSTSASKKAVAALQKKSAIIYRKYADEYTVFEGSDFDIEEALAKEKSAATLNLIDELNKESKLLPPIIAHKHVIETGNLRKFAPLFVDKNSYPTMPREGSTPRLVIYLSNGKPRAATLEKVCAHFSENDLLMFNPGYGLLYEAMVECYALRQLLNHSDLVSDKIALREVKHNLRTASHNKEAEVRALIKPSKHKPLYFRGKKMIATSGRELQSIFSDVMDEIFSAAPKIYNELINREVVSNTIFSARKKLSFAIVKGAAAEDLGIDKFPPEKAIYLSLLKKPNLHYKVKSGEWALQPPQAGGVLSDSNFAPFWQEIDSFFDSTRKNAKGITALTETLSAPPYGMSKALLPIFYVLAIVLNKDNLAVYEEGSYIPYFFEEHHIELFVTKPELFSFQLFDSDDTHHELMEQYKDSFASSKKRKPGDMLAISKPLIQFARGLPAYTQNTTAISTEAQKFLHAINNARSPRDMLVNDIPSALGFANAASQEFHTKLKDTIAEIETAYDSMQRDFHTNLIQGLGFRANSNLGKTRKELADYVHLLDKYTFDKDGLLAFLLRASDESDSDEQWFAKLLMQLGGKPASRWSDDDCKKAAFTLADYMRRMRDLKKLLLMQNKQLKNTSGVLLRIISEQYGEQEEFVSAKASKKSTAGMLKKAQYYLGKIDNHDKLAAAVKLLQDIISQQEKK